MSLTLIQLLKITSLSSTSCKRKSFVHVQKATDKFSIHPTYHISITKAHITDFEKWLAATFQRLFQLLLLQQDNGGGGLNFKFLTFFFSNIKPVVSEVFFCYSFQNILVTLLDVRLSQ